MRRRGLMNRVMSPTSQASPSRTSPPPHSMVSAAWHRVEYRTIRGSEVIEPGPEREAEVLQERLRIKTLIMPERMGNIFKALIQYKGLSERPQLSGLRKIF